MKPYCVVSAGGTRDLRVLAIFMLALQSDAKIIQSGGAPVVLGIPASRANFANGRTHLKNLYGLKLSSDGRSLISKKVDQSQPPLEVAVLTTPRTGGALQGASMAFAPHSSECIILARDEDAVSYCLYLRAIAEAGGEKLYGGMAENPPSLLLSSTGLKVFRECSRYSACGLIIPPGNLKPALAIKTPLLIHPPQVSPTPLKTTSGPIREFRLDLLRSGVQWNEGLPLGGDDYCAFKILASSLGVGYTEGEYT